MVEIDTDGLAKQNKDTVDLTTLAADTPEVISRQVFSLEFRPFQPYFLGNYQCRYNRSRSARKVYCCKGHFRLVWFFTAYAPSSCLGIRPLF